MEKTKIDWCDSSWNPVTGCLHGCEYCYARVIANRFAGFDDVNGQWNKVQYQTDADKLGVLNGRQYFLKESGERRTAPYPFGFAPTLHRYRLDDYATKKGRNIFVCSMADLFGDWVPDEWIQEVFEACERAPQHNYLFLTKNPGRYCLLEGGYGVPTADNMWYGTTVVTSSDVCRADYLPAEGNTFISIEPILEDIQPKDFPMFMQADWFIIGAETGNRKGKIVPERKWIEGIVSECRRWGKPVFMKSSLAEIWGEPLIQEFPEGLKKM